MFRQRRFHQIAVFGLLLTIAAIGYAQDYTQLRYVKTTDYGASWTGFVAAGDISSEFAVINGFPDFSAVVTSQNEISYAVVLHGGTPPGVYSVTGPAFTPVLVVAEGSNVYNWTDIGRTPNGDLFILIWGTDPNGGNTFWGVKSTDQGQTWGGAFVLATEPGLSPDATYPHLSQMNSASFCFFVFQIPEGSGYQQYFGRFPTAGGAATITNLNDFSGTFVSYYTGNCTPIAYDPAANWMYMVYRSNNLGGVAVQSSNDQGLTWNSQIVSGAQRYPSVAVNAAAQTPWVFTNYGVPASGAEHYAWNSYDEGQYGGGLWTARQDYAHVTYDGTDGLLYMNMGYWWDANRGVSSHNYWGTYTPNGLYTSRTTDGGATWIDFAERYYYSTDFMDPATVQNFELAGGTNGVAYVTSSGRIGAPDVSGPSIGNFQLLTPVTNLPPYTLSADFTDNNVDDSDNWITFWSNMIAGGDDDSLNSDSAHIVDPNTNSGTYFFHLPDSISIHGVTLQVGDTVWYYFWGRDLAGNSGSSIPQAIVVGTVWLDTSDPAVAAPTTFALRGNYPNPFNPETQIQFDLAAPTQVTLTVYNTIGQMVAKLADHQSMNTGTYSLTFNGADLPSGVYLYRLDAGGFSQTRKMVLVK